MDPSSDYDAYEISKDVSTVPLIAKPLSSSSKSMESTIPRILRFITVGYLSLALIYNITLGFKANILRVTILLISIALSSKNSTIQSLVFKSKYSKLFLSLMLFTTTIMAINCFVNMALILITVSKNPSFEDKNLLLLKDTFIDLIGKALFSLLFSIIICNNQTTRKTESVFYK